MNWWVGSSSTRKTGFACPSRLYIGNVVFIWPNCTLIGMVAANRPSRLFFSELCHSSFHWIGPTNSVIESQCSSVVLWFCGSAPSGAFFLGLSLALRSHDEFQASHWSSSPFGRENKNKKNIRPPSPKKLLGPPPKKLVDAPKNKTNKKTLDPL